MPDIQDILTQAELALDLVEAENVLTELQLLRDSWEDISEILEDLQSPKTFDEWLVAVLSAVDSDEVSEVLRKAGIADSIDNLKKWIGQIGDDTRAEILTLLRPLNGDFSNDGDTVEFPLFSIGTSVATQHSSPWSLSMGARSSVLLEANTSWPYASDGIDEDLLAIRATLDGGAKAAAKMPFQFGSVATEAAGEQSLELSYYFHFEDRNVPFAGAAAAAVAQTINPFSFNSVWKRLSSPESNAFGLTFDFTGKLSAGVTLSFAAIAEDAEVSIAPSVKLEATVRRPIEASLSLRRGRLVGLGHSVLFAMSRKRSTIRRYAATAGLEVDLSKSANVLHDVLQSKFEPWGHRLEDIKPFLSPGTYIRDHLKEELQTAVGTFVEDPELASALRNDASLALGLKADSVSEVKKWLEKLLTDKFDSFAGDFLSDKEDAVRRVSSQLLNDLPLVGVLGEAAQIKVKAQVEGLINKVLPKIRGKIRSIFNTIKDDIAEQVKLGEELQKIGVKANEAVSQVDNLANAISKILDSYFKRFRSFMELLQGTAKTTLTAEIDIEDVLERGSSFEFCGEFIEPTTEAKRLYHSLMVGGYSAVEAQVYDGVRTPGFIIDEERTKIGELSRKERNWGFKINLFGTGIGGREKLHALVETVASADGKLSVEAKGLAERSLTKRRDSRRFEFLSDVSLMHLRATANNHPHRLFKEALAFTMVYNEHSMEREEVEAFLSDLSSSPFRALSTHNTPTFVDPQSQVLALDRLDKFIKSPGSGAKLSGQLELKLFFDSDEIVKALTSPPPPDEELFGMMMRQFSRNGAFNSDEWAEFLEYLGRDEAAENIEQLSRKEQERDYTALFGLRIRRWHLKRIGGPRKRRHHAPKHEHVRQLIERSEALATFLHAARRIYFTPVSESGKIDDRKLREDVLAKDRAIMKIVSLGAGRADDLTEIGNITRFDMGISGRTIALMQVMNHLFNAQKPRLVVICKQMDGGIVKDQFVVA